MPLFSTDFDVPARPIFKWVLPILFILVIVVAIFYPKKSSPLEIIGYEKSECITEIFFDENNTKQSFDRTNYSRSVAATDATQLKNSVSPAKIKDPSRNPRNSRETILHLFYTGQVKLFQHLSATACLTEEKDSNKTYTAVFKVTHSYCTQECTEETYEIRTILNKDSGEITIEPK